jgi:UDP-glucose:(heptosyl)LPS alpha-1,3-glucosyltransferase
VHVYAHFFKDDAPPGIVPHTVPANEAFRAFRQSSFAANIDRTLRGQDFDIVHSFSRTYSQDILRLGGGTHEEYLRWKAEQASWLGKLWLRLNPRERVQLALDRRGLRPGAYGKVVVVSERGREELQRHHGVPASSIAVIRNGVDTGVFRPGVGEADRKRVREEAGFREGDLGLLFCGTNGKIKGLAYAIEALARVARETPARLAVLGEKHSAAYLKLARRLGVEDRVRFLGWLTSVENYYGAFDALVHPTLYDPFPNVCMEAMASGLPIVTTRAAGVSEILRDGDDAFIVGDGRDVASLAARLRDLADASLRARMGRAARETAERHPIEKTVREYLALYEEVRAMKGKPAAREEAVSRQ